MRRRIRCVFHAEATASLVQVKEGWRCYGACNKTYSNKEVEERTGVQYEYKEEEEPKEDLQEKFRYIHSLERTPIRGLSLPTDERGYYICWPGDIYYKYRLFNPPKGGKYLSPRGYSPPLLWVRKRL